MELPEKVREVESIFQKLDQEIAGFQSRSSLHCKQGCGKCCFKADIEATILEFLPFAFYLYREGKAEKWHERMLTSTSAVCEILDPTQPGSGLCSQYVYRGLICRLFGYSARTNKYGAKELVTCQIIKTEQSAAYVAAQEKIVGGDDVPVMNQFYIQLLAVDPDLARDFYPINEAIKKAIETVMHYYAYRDVSGLSNG